MFALSYNSVPNVRNYNEAVAQFETSKNAYGLCSESHNAAYLSRKHDSSKTVSLTPSGAVVFTYHHTDCVTYHPDNDVTVHAYPSRSTNTFVHCLTPYGFSPEFCYGPDPILWLHNRGYKLVGAARIRWNAEANEYQFPDASPWETKKPDTPAVSKQMRLLGWGDFEAFLRAAHATPALGQQFRKVLKDTTPLPWDRWSDEHNYQLVVGCLASQDYLKLASTLDRSGWLTSRETRTYHLSSEAQAQVRVRRMMGTVKTHMQSLVAKVHDLVDDVSYPYFVSAAQANTFRKHYHTAQAFLYA